MIDSESFYSDVFPVFGSHEPIPTRVPSADQDRNVFQPSHDSEQTAIELMAGERFLSTRGDAYRVISKLGEGGMGAVYKIVEEKKMGGEIVEMEHAMKVMPVLVFQEKTKQDREVAIKRFLREQAILANLHNPFVLSATDVIQIPVGEKVMVGFVTDFVRGTDLFQEMYTDDERTFMQPQKALEVVGEILIALDALERAGVVHRDLKPENIFLQTMPDGKKIVRLGDFGVAKFVGDETHETKRHDDEMPLTVTRRLTNTDSILGTPGYMAPEQYTDEGLSPKSDQYVLGIILFEMLTGNSMFPKNPAFSYKEFVEVAQKHIKHQLPSFEDKGALDVPEWLKDIVYQMLEKKPEHRFRSAREIFAVMKEGVKRDYPEMLSDIPFLYNCGSDIDLSEHDLV